MDTNAIAQKMGLLPEEDCSLVEKDVVLSNRGVRLDWLVNFFKEVVRQLQGEWEQFDNQARAAFYRDNVPEPIAPQFPRDQESTPAFLVPSLILPLTRKSKSPLYARIPVEYRGKPNLFVSHTWSQGLTGGSNFATPYAITGSVQQANYGPNPYIWIDIVSYNQHLFENIAPDMKDVISSIGQLCLPLLDATPFSRLWCLWELLCAHTTKSEIIICEPAASPYDMGYVYDIFTEKFQSVSDASTTLRKDKEDILHAMISTFGSIGRTDEYLRKLVEDSLTKESDKPWKRAGR